MNKILTLLAAGLICLTTAPAFCDETNVFARMGMATNEFAVLADSQTSLNDQVLAESLEIKHWNFQLQISNNWACYSMDFLWVENGTAHELGHGEIPVNDLDPLTGKQVRGLLQDKIVLLISPVDLSTEDPWRNSAKLRVFTTTGRSFGSRFIENPFKKNREGWATYSAPALVKKSPYKVEFKLITAGTNDEFRIAFNPGLHSTLNK
jgi:hypothetical protein